MSDPFIIDRQVLGTSRHLLANGGFSWVDEVPSDIWHLDGKLKQTPKCLDTLLKLAGVTIELTPPERYFNSMMTLMSGSAAWPPPWQDVMPKAAHRSFIESLVRQVAVALERADKNFYERVWVPGNHVFSSLQRATINKEIWEAWMESGEGNVGALRTFEPDDSGRAALAIYDRFGSRTGRPSMASGPNILTLKREQRDIIGSRWGSQGRIAYVDFSALEVRVILYEGGQRCDSLDLYQELNEELFRGKLPRDAVKGAVICDLYGQSKWALGQKLGLKGNHLNMFIDTIRSHFKTDALLARIKQQFVETGYITNHYGRRVTIEEPLDHILVNAYAQSTGIDVATLGFKRLLDDLVGLRVEPVFLLVDAIIMDCHVDDFAKVQSMTSLNIDGYTQPWYLKVDEL